jgi:hypothetical protein
MKLNEQQLTALKDSIEHWRRMAEGVPNVGEEPYSSDCSLCTQFRYSNYSNDYSGYCIDCPVAISVLHGYCARTPYRAAEEAFSLYGGNSIQFKAAARKELEFLESLLPK